MLEGNFEMMCIFEAIINTLQQNAEWLCAIAITYFAYKQYAITKLQIQQDLRMRRLELAQKLDEACKEFPYNTEKANKLLEWCTSHQSEFIFLLQGKDSSFFAQLMKFVLDLRYKYMMNPQEILETDIKHLYSLVEKLDYALGNAKYGLTEIKQNEGKK